MRQGDLSLVEIRIENNENRYFRRYIVVITTWLGMRFEERELYDREPAEESLERLQTLLEGNNDAPT